MKTNKEQFDWYKENAGWSQTHEDRIKLLVNTLIESLYVPVKGFNGLTKVDSSKIPKGYGMLGEAINWGDLKCIEVAPIAENEWRVVIDEADENCPELHRYIKEYMESWGWFVEVVTEW